MSPPPHLNYADKYWADMPEAAHKAAAVLGYDQAKWDSDTAVPYDTKTFFECSAAEKQAAMFVNLNPIAKKLNVWWSDLDATTKEQATALGWTEEKWNDDWEIEHLEVEHLYWDSLSAAQKTAANHFGYTQSTWDESFVDFVPTTGGAASAAAAKPAAAAAASAPAATTDKPEKKMFTPPPKGKVFEPLQKKEEDHKDEKKEDDNDDDDRKKVFIKPLKKLFNKLTH
jgi:hypothetical protein